MTTGAAMLVLTGVLLWSSASGRMSQRHSELYTSQAAAEAATEKVIAQMSRDFQVGGASGVEANEATYTSLAPSGIENPAWANYEFASPGGVPVYVNRASNWSWGPLNWKYTSMNATNAVYRVIANARDLGSGNNITAAIRQDVQVAEIPLFSFLAFYNLDLELGAVSGNWNWNGPVHGNANLYLYPQSIWLTAHDHVTACGEIRLASHPDNCSQSFSSGNVTFQREHDSRVNALRLPGGMAATNLWSYYRSVADLAIEVRGNSCLDWDLSCPKMGVVWSPCAATNFVRTDRHFKDKRENDPSGPEEMRATEFDLGAYFTNPGIYTIGGQLPKVIYLADLRFFPGGDKACVRITNGMTLPAGGLSLATPNPLYVLGHYNLGTFGAGTTNTTGTRPACLAGDAVTVLSGAWNDTNSTLALFNRQASSNTVNAAILTGIVPTSANGMDCYSGGMEDAVRLLEWWNLSQTLSFNGSLVVLFPSQVATEPWGNSGVFFRPNRVYRFDENFRDPTKLPPATPFLRTLIRSEWKSLPPGATS